LFFWQKRACCHVKIDSAEIRNTKSSKIKIKAL
jgi:hypothetical protein